MSCGRLEEDRPLCVPARAHREPPQQACPGVAGACLPRGSGQQRFDSSFQMAAGPDENPGLRKVNCCLRDGCCACAADPVCSHAWVPCRGEIKRAKTPHLSKVSLFLSFPGNEGISPTWSFLQCTHKIVLMWALETGIGSAPSLKEEPISVPMSTKGEGVVYRVAP